MTKKSIGLDDRLYDYLLAHSLHDTPILRELRDITAGIPMARMQIAPEQGQFMTLLVKLIRAKRILEIGTFTGYSALCMAMALPEDGYLLTCDIDEEATKTARKYWQRAGVDEKIELRTGPAVHTLQEMLETPECGEFDLMFIDADKTRYRQYYELGLQLVRAGGLILVDNVLWNGNVADPGAADPETMAIREFNRMLYRDERVELCMLPLADGLTLAMKPGE